jgi:hypothetical protein
MPTTRIPAALSWAVAGLALIAAVGCDLPERPILEQVEPLSLFPTQTPVNDQDVERFELPTVLDQPNWETWDAYYINNEHVGYSHVKSSTANADTPGDLSFELDHRVYQSSGKARVLERMLLSCNETTAGRMVAFDGRLQTGLAVTRFTGDLDGATLIVERRDGSQFKRREIPWEMNYRGMFAVEQSLRAQPMREINETRVMRLMISGQFQVATARLRCSGTAVVPLQDGSERELIEINVEIKIDDAQPIYSAIWTDDRGQVLRYYSPMSNLIGYRTDMISATAIQQDDLVPVAIAVQGEMDRPEQTKRVAYRIQVSAGNAAEPVTIKPAPGQFIRTTDEGETQVLVSRQEEKPSGGFADSQPEPTKGDEQANFFIDSRAEIVTKFATAAVGKSKLSKQELAVELAGTANRMLIHNPARCGLAKASEIAQRGEGDSLQGAILLAALLRSQKIPARLAVGLRYAPPTEPAPGELPPRVPSEPRPRMVAHVWNMAHVGDRWIHLDAFDGQQAAADRLVLASTDLGDGDENAVFRALNRDVSAMQIEILATKY